MQDSRIPRRGLIKHAFAMTAELRTTLRAYTDNWADTHDLLQDLYVLLLDKEIGDPNAAHASIRQLANKIGAEWRGRKTSSPINLDSMSVDVAATASEESPEALADTEQRRALLRQVVSQFTERQKMAWQLVKGKGLSCKEAARAMQISDGTVKAHVRDGLILCRRFIQGKGDSHEE
jgi:RNA polymerase sigma factor (sigma-70 family)